MPVLTLQNIFMWGTAPFLQLLCAYLIFRRKLQKQFHFFVSYLIFLTLHNVVLLACYAAHLAWTYYVVYWVGTALTDMFAIVVLYEIFCAVFKPFAGLQDLAKVMFRWAAAAILLIVLLVYVTSPTMGAMKLPSLFTAGVLAFERVVRIMQCALLLFLFIGSEHLGVSPRNRVFGFALGLGVDAFFQLLVLSALVSSHMSRFPLLAQLSPMVYYVALLIWTGYLLQPEPARQTMHIPVTSPLLRWNEVALSLGHSGGQVALMQSEPFMPSVERMVEQVMKKEMIERRQQRAAVV
jgi:hypothetical protein